jgi:cytochrome P450
VFYSVRIFLFGLSRADTGYEPGMTVPDSALKFPFAQSPSLYAPAAELRPLTEHQPVAPVVLPDGRAAWLVTGYDEVRQVHIDPRFSRALAAEQERGTSGFAAFAADTILGLDPPDHTRLRKLVASAFTARRVEGLRPRVIAIVGERLAAMAAGPRPADLISNFSLALPVRVICDLLGVPEQDQEQFRSWSEKLISSADVTLDEVMAAVGALAGYFAELIAAKRAAPADDLMTALIAARDDADRLSEQELITLCVTLLIGGYETTANQMVMSLLTLLEYPGELARLRADRALIPDAVEELMRFVQLSKGGLPPGRVTTEAVELGGVLIPAGAMVLPFFNAANRDSGEFPDPDRLDLSRGPRGHVAFGAGVHHCLGAQLARLELQEAFTGLLTVLPGIRLGVPLSELRFREKLALYSLHELPVTWDD